MSSSQEKISGHDTEQGTDSVSLTHHQASLAEVQLASAELPFDTQPSVVPAIDVTATVTGEVASNLSRNGSGDVALSTASRTDVLFPGTIVTYMSSNSHIPQHGVSADGPVAQPTTSTLTGNCSNSCSMSTTDNVVINITSSSPPSATQATDASARERDSDNLPPTKLRRVGKGKPTRRRVLTTSSCSTMIINKNKNRDDAPPHNCLPKIKTLHRPRVVKNS